MFWMPNGAKPSGIYRLKQTDVIPVRGSSASVSPNRLSYGCPTTIFRDPGTDTDIISAQHFWTGGLETAGPGCYDAIAGGGFPNAGYEPHPSCDDCPLTARSRPKRAAKTSRKIVAGQQ